METLGCGGEDATDKCLRDLKSNCPWWGLRRKGSMLGPGYNAGLLGWVVTGSAWRGIGVGPYTRKGQWGGSSGGSFGLYWLRDVGGEGHMGIFSKCCKMRLKFWDEVSPGDSNSSLWHRRQSSKPSRWKSLLKETTYEWGASLKTYPLA